MPSAAHKHGCEHIKSRMRRHNGRLITCHLLLACLAIKLRASNQDGVVFELLTVRLDIVFKKQLAFLNHHSRWERLHQEQASALGDSLHPQSLATVQLVPCPSCSTIEKSS